MNEHDFMGAIEFPEINHKCIECPFLCDIQPTFARASLGKRILTHVGEQSMSDDEQLQTILEAVLPEDINVEELLQSSRQGIGAALESVDNDISQLTHMIEAAQLSCEGVLKMRARKGPTEYTVSVCTAKEVNTYISPEDRPTRVDMKDITS